MLVGDSFTFGTGGEYEQTYGVLIASALRGVDPVNLAMPGFGIDQMWMTVRHYALPLRPALIIVGFIDDDFDRSLTAYSDVGFNKPTFVLDHDRLRPATARDHPGSVVSALERHSALWTGVRVALRRLAYRVPLGEWWRLNRDILDRLRTDCQRSGVPVVFVRIPSQRSRPRFEVLHRHMQRVGAQFLDLADPAAAPGPEVFFPLDGHINARGHSYVADQVLQWIRTALPSLVTGRAPGHPPAGDGTPIR